MVCRGFSQPRLWLCCRHESRQVYPDRADCRAGPRLERSSQVQRHRKRWREEQTVAVSGWLGERTWDHATGILLKPTRATPTFQASRFNRDSLVVNVRDVRERLQCFLSQDAIRPERLQTSRTGG